MQQAPFGRGCTYSLQAILLLALCISSAHGVLNVGQHLKAMGEAAMGAVDPRLWDVANPATGQEGSGNGQQGAEGSGNHHTGHNLHTASEVNPTKDRSGDGSAVAGEVLEEAHQHAMQLLEQAQAAMLDLGMPQPAGAHSALFCVRCCELVTLCVDPGPLVCVSDEFPVCSRVHANNDTCMIPDTPCKVQLGFCWPSFCPSCHLFLSHWLLLTMLVNAQSQASGGP